MDFAVNLGAAHDHTGISAGHQNRAHQVQGATHLVYEHVSRVVILLKEVSTCANFLLFDCDWVEAEAPASVDLPVEGAAALKAAVITVVLHYTTTGPLA